MRQKPTAWPFPQPQNYCSCAKRVPVVWATPPSKAAIGLLGEKRSAPHAPKSPSAAKRRAASWITTGGNVIFTPPVYFVWRITNDICRGGNVIFTAGKREVTMVVALARSSFSATARAGKHGLELWSGLERPPRL